MPAISALPARPPISHAAPLPKGNETLLIVEDEPAVRQFLRAALGRYGYKVLESIDGADAIHVAASYSGPIHLLITDVVMPGMGGREVAQQVMLYHGETRVLYVSGYTDDAVVRHGVIDAVDSFLQKPFSPLALARKVRTILDEGH